MSGPREKLYVLSVSGGHVLVDVALKHEGLAVTLTTGNSIARTHRHVWVITHLNTGAALGVTGFTEETARKLVVRLAAVLPWTSMGFDDVTRKTMDPVVTAQMRAEFRCAQKEDGYEVPEEVLQ